MSENSEKSDLERRLEQRVPIDLSPEMQEQTKNWRSAYETAAELAANAQELTRREQQSHRDPNTPGHVFRIIYKKVRECSSAAEKSAVIRHGLARDAGALSTDELERLHRLLEHYESRESEPSWFPGASEEVKSFFRFLADRGFCQITDVILWRETQSLLLAVFRVLDDNAIISEYTAKKHRDIISDYFRLPKGKRFKRESLKSQDAKNENNTDLMAVAESLLADWQATAKQ